MQTPPFRCIENIMNHMESSPLMRSFYAWVVSACSFQLSSKLLNLCADGWNAPTRTENIQLKFDLLDLYNNVSKHHWSLLLKSSSWVDGCKPCVNQGRIFVLEFELRPIHRSSYAFYPVMLIQSAVQFISLLLWDKGRGHPVWAYSVSHL